MAFRLLLLLISFSLFLKDLEAPYVVHAISEASSPASIITKLCKYIGIVEGGDPPMGIQSGIHRLKPNLNKISIYCLKLDVESRR